MQVRLGFGLDATAFTGCGKIRTMSFRRAGFAGGICRLLEAGKKSRSLASLGMTKKHSPQPVSGGLQRKNSNWNWLPVLAPAVL